MKQKYAVSYVHPLSKENPRWLLWRMMADSQRKAAGDSGSWRLFSPGQDLLLRNKLAQRTNWKGRRWTEREDEYLRKWYMAVGRRRVAAVLNRNPATITKRAQFLGLRVRKVRTWTKREIEYVRQHYVKQRPAEIARKLARTAESIKQCAKHLGIRKHFRSKNMEMSAVGDTRSAV